MKSKKNDMLDLQLFAQASDQLQNTTATLTAEMKTYYEKRLLDQAEPALVHNQFGDPYPQRPDLESEHGDGRAAPVWWLGAHYRRAENHGAGQQRAAGDQDSGQPGGPHPGQRDP